MTLAAGCVFAYLTSTDTKINKFELAEKLEIHVVEDIWDAQPDLNTNGIPDHAEGLIPTQEVVKDPAIENTTNVPAYVFADVTVPIRNIKTANIDGTLNNPADTELFSYTVNEGWTLADTIPSTDGKSITYRYKYNDVLQKDRTATIFDKVTYANVADDKITGDDLIQQLIVNGHAVQTEGFDSVDEAYESYFEEEESSTPIPTDIAFTLDANGGTRVAGQANRFFPVSYSADSTVESVALPGANNGYPEEITSPKMLPFEREGYSFDGLTWIQNGVTHRAKLDPSGDCINAAEDWVIYRNNGPVEMVRCEWTPITYEIQLVNGEEITTLATVDYDNKDAIVFPDDGNGWSLTDGGDVVIASGASMNLSAILDAGATYEDVDGIYVVKLYSVQNESPVAYAAVYGNKMVMGKKMASAIPTSVNGQELGTFATDVETSDYANADDVAWAEDKATLDSVIVEEEIKPVSMAHWFHDLTEASSIDGMENVDSSNVDSMVSLFENTPNVKCDASMLVLKDGVDTTMISHNMGDVILPMAFSDMNAVSLAAIYNAPSWRTGEYQVLVGRGSLPESYTDDYNVSWVKAMEWSDIEEYDAAPWWLWAVNDNPTDSTSLMGPFFMDWVRPKSLTGWFSPVMLEKPDTAPVDSVLNMCDSRLYDPPYIPYGRVGTMVDEFTLARLDLSQCDSMDWAFVRANYNFQSWTVDLLNRLDTSHVKSMRGCFARAACDVSGLAWDTSSVTDMSHMFTMYTGSKVLDLSALDTSSVKTMASMFGCNGNGGNTVKSIDMSGWDTSHVEDMTQMFHKMDISEIDISSFDTSSVKHMGGMFALWCSSGTQVRIYVSERWTTDAVEMGFYADNTCDVLFGTERMFMSGAAVFVGGAGSTSQTIKSSDITYARIDDPDNGCPGYFTYKAATV